jgi:HK97 family phage portal protein
METKAYKIFGIKVFERSLFTNIGTLTSPTAGYLDSLKTTSLSGAAVTEETALSITAVWRAISVLSGTMAALPLQIYQNTDNGRRNDKKHPTHKLLRNPNKLMSEYIFRETMQAILLTYGNAYAYIRRNSNSKPIELIIIHPDDVLPLKSADEVFYQIKTSNETLIVSADNMLHLVGLGFNGLIGKSPVRVMRESLGVAISAQEYGANFFGNGAHLSGVIEAPGTVNDETLMRLRNSWNDAYQGVQKAGKTAILEAGMKFTRIGIPPNDAQFLETRQFQVTEVARMFGVQPHLLMDLERSTNNNIEHQSIEFVTFTLTPWIARWESEINRKLFKADEGYYCEYNLNGLLRGDAKSRAEYYRTMFAIGGMSPNEIRSLENQPNYTGGEKYFAQAGYMPIDSLEDYYKNKNAKNVKAE